jgi:flavine halogenase
LTHEDVVKTVEFCLQAFKETTPEERKKVLDKIASMNGAGNLAGDSKEDLEKLTEDELAILNNIRAKQMLRLEDSVHLKHFGSDAIEGFAPNLVTGKLGLVPKSNDTALSRLEAPVVDLLIEVKDNAAVTAAA